jgi:hypothetical protein
MKQRAKTVAAKPPATRPAVMFLRAVSRSTAGFLSVREGVWPARVGQAPTGKGR